MKISVVTDEVSSDPETALEILRSWGVENIELRGIDDSRYPMVSDYWRVRLPQLLDEFGLRVIAISPGLFQVAAPGRSRPPLFFNRGGDMRAVRDTLHDEARLEDHLQKLLPASIEAAQRLGARSIICFAFFSRPDHTDAAPVSDEAIQVMRFAADKVGEAGLTLNIEVSEPSQRTADLVRRVDSSGAGHQLGPGGRVPGR